MVANSTALIENNDVRVEDLLEISFHKKKEIAFRAAWMLEYLMVNKPAKFVGHIPELLALLPDQKNHSALRHYTKIVSLLTTKNVNEVYQKVMESLDLEPVIEILFEWLVKPATPVAVKVHCMQSLANLAWRHDWIKNELLETIDYLVDLESVAFFARAKMVRKQLRRKK